MNDMRKLMETAAKLNEAPKKAKPGFGQRAPSGGEMPMISVVTKIEVVDDYGSEESFDIYDKEDAITLFAESYAEYHLPAGSASRDTARQWDKLYEKGRRIAMSKLRGKIRK